MIPKSTAVRLMTTRNNGRIIASSTNDYPPPGEGQNLEGWSGFGRRQKKTGKLVQCVCPICDRPAFYTGHEYICPKCGLVDQRMEARWYGTE
jgi:hypothetical protein